MKSRWNETEAANAGNDPLKLRVYTSRLLGQEEDLVLHGGGNTSVKTKERNIFGEEEEIIYVKGSGWDLASIEEAGFAPVKLKELLKLARLEHLSDTEMVKYQRMAMTDPSAPNPSIEAILHALIPFDFVDHTHADAVVTISNTPTGEERIREIYGDDFLIVPYVMPGFILAREIYLMTRDKDWNKLKGMILLNHGVFTFNNRARISYENMIEAVTRAENYLADNNAIKILGNDTGRVDTLSLARIRQEVSILRKKPVLARFDNSEENTAFSNWSEVKSAATRGPITPDHIIRTKRVPAIIGSDIEQDLNAYADEYEKYFNEYTDGELTILDRAPRWVVWPGYGTISFGLNEKEITVISDISKHNMQAVYRAEKLGGWTPLPQKELFEMEYWELEQAKLKKAGGSKVLQGKIALVTGAANGIGKACVEKLIDAGAVVAALDIDQSIESCFDQKGILGIQCEITDPQQVQNALEKIVSHFGGLDLLISNAGIFPKSCTIDKMEEKLWQKSMDVNLNAHQKLLKLCLPYLELGIEPAVVLMGSKNVPAPGPGAAAYSVAKAGLTQFGRIAAMELGGKGIRVNILHPNAVYDTGIWTEEVLQSRATHYGLTVAEYKTRNFLKTEVSSRDVAELAVSILGPAFAKTTGAQIPIDGGDERVI